MRPLAEDGKEFRAFARAEFVKWHRLANRDATMTEVEALADKLSAKEMIRLARIEKARFQNVIPEGKQQTTMSVNSDKDEYVEPATLQNIAEAMKG